MELGIFPVFSNPASPQQNGSHERTAFKEKKLGFEDIGNGIYRVWFREFFLVYLNEHELKICDILEYDYILRM